MKHFKKLNAKGFAHWVIPALAIIVIGGVGTTLLTLSHADTLTSITIWPSNWQYLSGASIVTVGSTGSAVKIAPGTNASGSYHAISSSTHTTTATYPYGVPLAKVTNFIQSNYGKAAQVCATVRAGTAGTGFGLQLTNVAANTFKDKLFSASTNYANYCMNFTVIGSQAFAANHSDPNVLVGQIGGSSALFVDKVTIKVQ